MTGLAATVFYTITGFVLSMLIGLIVAFGQLSKKKVCRTVAEIYLSWFRSTPLLVQLVLIYYGLPILFHIDTKDWVCGIIALGMYSGAYVSQVIRGAIVSIDKGQMEAGRSLGYSQGQTMRKIVLPQAFRRMLAPLTNELISLTKNSSLLSGCRAVPSGKHTDCKELQNHGGLYFRSYFILHLKQHLWCNRQGA